MADLGALLVVGGDDESGDEFGSSLIGGEVGERTLAEAKTAAQADYGARYREADQVLDALLACLLPMSVAPDTFCLELRATGHLPREGS
jgi:hypothetical protein